MVRRVGEVLHFHCDRAFLARVQLKPRLCREYFDRPVVERIGQASRRPQRTVPAVERKAAIYRVIAEYAPAAKIAISALDRSHLAGRNQVLVNDNVSRSRDLQRIAGDGFLAAEIKIDVIREIYDCGSICIRSVGDVQFVLRRPNILRLTVEIAGKTLIAVAAAQGEDDAALILTGNGPIAMRETVRPSVQGVAVFVRWQLIANAVESEDAARNAVAVNTIQKTGR